jgi:predicted PurR-regulated permease PerM
VNQLIAWIKMTNRNNNHKFMSPLQQRFVSVAIVILALNLMGAFFLGVFWSLRWAVGYLSDILWPLAVAGILALLLRPVVLGLQLKLKTGRAGAIILLYTLTLILILALAAFILPVIIHQAGSFIEYLPTLLERFSNFLGGIFQVSPDWINNYLSTEALNEHLGNISRNFREILETSMPALSTMGEFILQTFTIIAGFLIIPIYLFFFLLADQSPVRVLKDELSFIPEKIREDTIFLTEEFARIMVAFFRGQIIIGLIMGILMAIGFSIVNLKFGAFLGIMIGLLNIIPYLGSILGLLTVLPLAFFQDGGGLLLLLSVLGIFVMVQLLESYVLTPKIMGRSTGLHPLAIIISIFFWGKALNGILGMILAIPLTAFFVVAWRLIRRKYLA